MPGIAVLPGERVDLRPIEEDDLEFLQTRINDPRVRRGIGRAKPVTGAQNASSSRTSSATTTVSPC